MILTPKKSYKQTTGKYENWPHLINAMLSYIQQASRQTVPEGHCFILTVKYVTQVSSSENIAHITSEC